MTQLLCHTLSFSQLIARFPRGTATGLNTYNKIVLLMSLEFPQTMAENTHWSLGRGGSMAERLQLLIFEIYTTQLETLVYKHP